HLNLSQTALSHRMKKFEEDLGVTLLIRTTRQVSLTPVGLELLPKARKLMEELATSLDRIREHGSQQDEQVVIGALPTIAAHQLPRILHAFRDSHPGVAVKIHDNSSMEIAQLVQSGVAEFGLTIVSSNVADLDI